MHQIPIYRLLVLVAVCLCGAGAQQAPAIDEIERSYALSMLRDGLSELKKSYYDPTFNGVDIEARFKEAERRINAASSLNEAMTTVAWALDALEDSHTFFLPPPRPYKHSYGWLMQMIGVHCYVTGVQPGTDAETQGLHVGDRIESINGFAPARESLNKMKYVYNILRPQPALRLEVRGTDGQLRTLDVRAQLRETKRVVDLIGEGIWNEIREAETAARLRRHRYYKIADDLMIWKMPQFDLDEGEIADMMKDVRKHKALILDLRGNSGGAVETLTLLLGQFFEHEVKIGDEKRRKETKPQIAKRDRHFYGGELIVLVDSESASAAEIFARVVQMEKRGRVLGDVSAGAVMGARIYPFFRGHYRKILYAF